MIASNETEAKDSLKTYLKYANLQMAAEAMFDKPHDLSYQPGLSYSLTSDQLKKWLEKGNGRNSKFTPTQAQQFIDAGWVVKEHMPNTATGFSGTLFYNSKTGEYVLSLRSTEFVDDAVRDCLVTNNMEIKERGWAFGQIADMQNWFESMQQRGVLESGAYRRRRHVCG